MSLNNNPAGAPGETSTPRSNEMNSKIIRFGVTSATRKLQTTEDEPPTPPIPGAQQWVPKHQQVAIARRFFDAERPDGIQQLSRRCRYKHAVVEAITRSAYWQLRTQRDFLLEENRRLCMQVNRRAA